MRLMISLIAVLVASAVTTPTKAVTVIPVMNRTDMVHDAKRGVVYVTNGGSLDRFQLDTATFLPPLNLGGQLAGIDLSPDGDTLVVADKAGSATDSWVYLVALDSLAVSKVSVAKAFSEGGIFTAVYGADDNVYTTSTFNGSGWIPFRKLDPSTGQWTDLASVRQNTMLAASGDGQTIAFAESNISDGEWGLYDIPTGQIVRRQGYTDGTSWFNYEIATDRLGTQFSIPTYGGTFVYDDNYQKIGTFGTYAGQQPSGVAYHPVEQLAYFPWVGTSQVRVYDMSTLTQVGAYNFGDQFTNNGNFAFVQGRTRLSRDGSLLMVTVTGGVGLQSQYAPLSAANVSASTNVGQSVNITLQGSIGNNGALSYEIASAPAYGTAAVNGMVATYTPPGGFHGSDSFAYRVHYGRAIADGLATVVVGQNHPPVAVDATVNTNEDTAVNVALQASDVDGDSLAYTVLTQPQHGTLSGSGSSRTYTPAPNFNGADSITFVASDSQSSSNVATITIQVASVNDAPYAISDSVTMVHNSSVTIAVLANDGDVDGNIISISSVSSPAHGTAVISGNAIVYAPARGYAGADQFTYTISDGRGGSATASVAISVLKK